MLRGYRGIFFALVGWLILSAQPPQPKAEAKQTEPAAKANEPPAPVRSPPVQPVELVNLPVDSPEYQQRCERGQDSRDSDLCAQWKAADAARDAADHARTQLWIALGGIAGLLATLFLTVLAVRAARDSVRVAQETARLQLRPYVLPFKSRIKPPKKGRKGWTVTIRIRNGGATPARNVVCWFEAFLTDLPLPREFSELEGPTVDFAFIGPHDERFLMAIVEITGEDAKRIKQRRAAVVARMRARYDYFDKDSDTVPLHEVMAIGADMERGLMRVLPEWAWEEPEADEEGQEQLNLGPPSEEQTDEPPEQ